LDKWLILDINENYSENNQPTSVKGMIM